MLFITLKEFLLQKKVKCERYLLRRRMKYEGVQIISKMNEAFEELNKSYWLEFGTLLGAIREHGLIKHDLDFDFSTFYSGDEFSMIRCISKRGFRLFKTIELDGKIVELTFAYNGCYIDIFLYHLCSDGKMFCYLFNPARGLTWEETKAKYGGFLTRTITHKKTSLIDYNFLGVNVKVPENYHEYLQDIYGPTYMIPDPDFTYSDTDCIKEIKDKYGVQTIYSKHSIFDLLQ